MHFLLLYPMSVSKNYQIQGLNSIVELLSSGVRQLNRWRPMSNQIAKTQLNPLFANLVLLTGSPVIFLGHFDALLFPLGGSNHARKIIQAGKKLRFVEFDPCRDRAISHSLLYTHTKNVGWTSSNETYSPWVSSQLKAVTSYQRMEVRSNQFIISIINLCN